jgi:hypothetical protein
MNRWVLRVAAYAGLMTDDYPPFRLDMGEHEPDAGGAMTLAPSVAGAGAPTTQSTPTLSTPTPPSPTSTPGPRHFGPGRVLALVVGAMMALAAVPVLVGGGAVLWADRTQRDDAGFLTSPASDVSTTTYALTSRADSFTIDADTPDWVLGDVVGDVRVRVTPTDATPVFVGIARSRDVERYLAGTSYATIDSLDDGVSTAVPSPGIGAPASPDEQPFWVAKATGPGTQTLQWPMREGDWRIVVMKPDGAAGVAVRADIAAEAPVLPWVAAGLLIAGVLLLAAGTTLIVVASVARTKRTP